jgi:hypothetical protein
MEQTQVGTRPVVGGIVMVSGLAVTFLLWLVYVHHASADFAGRWMFLPALNALLNGFPWPGLASFLMRGRDTAKRSGQRVLYSCPARDRTIQ